MLRIGAGVCQCSNVLSSELVLQFFGNICGLVVQS